MSLQSLQLFSDAIQYDYKPVVEQIYREVFVLKAVCSINIKSMLEVFN